ncbi:hypothetical protein [Burkholderia diffusa]|uniref:hypothetical protein n=1 Tax=Burkholderia diffusa TaxID=488732 RepID=UPI001FC7C6C5|nr:hypothetical protein [Burkholderia diffusa]
MVIEKLVLDRDCARHFPPDAMMRRGGMGCGMDGHRHAPHEYGSQERHTHEDGARRDPLNGHLLDESHALTSLFDRRTYYIESEQSRAEFNSDPQRFAGHSEHRRHHGGC